MTRQSVLRLLASLALAGAVGMLQAKESEPDSKHDSSDEPDSLRILKDESQITSGFITIRGAKVSYQAQAGVQAVYLKDPKDEDPQRHDDKGDPPPIPQHAAMSYVAYFKGDREDPRRPITFLFNGGPGSSTVWLHMGAFGPKRVITANDSHSAAAPYRITDNEYSLLDASDLVFIDAPGTGFGHIRGADKEKAFYGVDQDAHTFANFVVQFLSTHGRWNSPKYLFGESYGTTRAAQLASILQEEKSVDLNGVILLSQVLSFDNGPDGPELNPGVDQPYALALPTYAATAWYHKRLPNQPTALEPFIKEVEDFALGDYMSALAQGS